MPNSTSGIPGQDPPLWAGFFGVMGTSCAMIFTVSHPFIFEALGAAYGTAKAGSGIAGMSVARPDLIMKSIIPVVMAGIIAIYGLVVAVVLASRIGQAFQDVDLGSINNKGVWYSAQNGFLDFSAGLSVGICGLAAGGAIGLVGDTGVRGTAHQPRLFVGMILVLIFSEVLGLYGLIVALLLSAAASN